MSATKADPAGDMAEDSALNGDMRALLEWLLSTNRVSEGTSAALSATPRPSLNLPHDCKILTMAVHPYYCIDRLLITVLVIVGALCSFNRCIVKPSAKPSRSSGYFTYIDALSLRCEKPAQRVLYRQGVAYICVVYVCTGAEDGSFKKNRGQLGSYVGIVSYVSLQVLVPREDISLMQFSPPNLSLFYLGDVRRSSCLCR